VFRRPILNSHESANRIEITHIIVGVRVLAVLKMLSTEIASVANSSTAIWSNIFGDLEMFLDSNIRSNGIVVTYAIG
jgi:hypothetical protein